jgi:beta-N-acetylhexosaminidase
MAPFEAAVAEGVPVVMLSHAFYAAHDPVTPASLSRPIATHLLRDELGFTGVAMTDDLDAGAIRATSGVAPAAVAALNAGSDLLLVSSPEAVPAVREALLAAVASREIPPARLDQAVGRVLELKRAHGLLDAAGGLGAGAAG